MSQIVHAPRGSAPSAATANRISLDAAGVRLFAAYWGSLALVDLSGQSLAMAVPMLVGLVTACSIGQRWLLAAAVGAIGWCFLTGFVVNGEGDLTVHTANDLVWFTALVTTALAAAWLSRVVRR